VAQPCLIHFKAWKDWYIFISVGHGFELRLLEEGCKVNCSLHVDFDKHQLVDEFVFEVGKMGEQGSIFVKNPMVTGCLVARLSDLMNTLVFLSHARRLFSLLWNLILPRVRLLNTWHPMHMWFWLFCLARGVEMLQNCLNTFSPAGSGVISKMIC